MGVKIRGRWPTHPVMAGLVPATTTGTKPRNCAVIGPRDEPGDDAYYASGDDVLFRPVPH